MNRDLNTRLVENKQNLEKQDESLDRINQLMMNTNDNLREANVDLVDQRGKIQQGIDKVDLIFGNFREFNMSGSQILMISLGFKIGMV